MTRTVDAVLYAFNAGDIPYDRDMALCCDEILRLRALTTWRDIKDAPNNESILVFSPNTNHYGEGIWRAVHVDMGTGKWWMSTALHIGRDMGPECWPTHFLPLPPPPTEEPER